MTEILNGETSLQFACDGGDILSSSAVDGNTETIIRIDGEISLNASTEGDCELQTHLDGAAVAVFISGSDEYEKYTGSYEVTPKAEKQTLSTKNKVMASDVTVRSIPTYEVSNESGGTTFLYCRHRRIRWQGS